MNSNKIFDDLSNKFYVDVIINLIDDHHIIHLSLHKLILGTSSQYFHKLFNFAENKNKSFFDVVVPNANIANDIILSFYGPNTDFTNNSDWLYLLETLFINIDRVNINK